MHGYKDLHVMDYELLCSRFLGNQDLAPILKNICELTRKYKADRLPEGGVSQRKADLISAAKRAQGLRNALGKLDQRVLVEAMGNPRGEPILSPDTPPPGAIANLPFEPPALPSVYRSYLYIHLAELDGFMAKLERIATALNAASQTLPIARGRPPTRDPLVFAMEALAELWRRTHDEQPKYSFKQNQFGDFALTLLGSNGLKFEDKAVRTAVRNLLLTSS